MTEEEQRFFSELRKLRLAVSPEQAWRLLQQIEHKKFGDALPTYWRIEGGAAVPESICWLFCWAKTGINSPRARDDCRRAFERIFPEAFGRLNSSHFHKFARKFRYHGSKPIHL